MGKLDKKQKIQVAIMVALSCGLFGYFTFRMIMPTPAAAQSGAVPPAAAKVADGPAKQAAKTEATVADQDAPAPTAGMRDPFQPTISSQASPAAPANPSVPPAVGPKTASKGSDTEAVSVPPVPVLPPAVGHHPFATGQSSSSAEATAHDAPAPLPVEPDAPQWTVTGVLQSGEENVAILRSGEVRRIVRVGDMVDSQFRIASVTRDEVVLRHGGYRFSLPLGGPKTPPVKPVQVPGSDLLNAQPGAVSAAGAADEDGLNSAISAHDSATASVQKIHALEDLAK